MRFRRSKKTDVESEKALEEARENLREVQKRGGEVSKVANALKDLRERNHFAEQMEAIIIRQRGEPLR